LLRALHKPKKAHTTSPIIVMDTPADTSPETPAETQTKETEPSSVEKQEDNSGTKREAERTTEEENEGAPPTKKQNTGSETTAPSDESSTDTSAATDTTNTPINPCCQKWAAEAGRWQMQYSQLLQSYTALASATGMMGMPTTSATAPPGATSATATTTPASTAANPSATGVPGATPTAATTTPQQTAVMQQQQQQQAAYGYPYGYAAAAYGYAAAMQPQQAVMGASSSSGPAMPSPKLFIFHLPPILTEQQLLDLFRPYGNVVDCHIARDAMGASRGYGFIKYTTTEEATLAISRMNGFQVGGKYLKVDYKK